MRIHPARAAEEFVDPRRAEFPSFDLCLVEHDDFTSRSNGQLEHSGTAVSTWNRSFRSGFCRSIQGAARIDHLTEAIHVYHNPNVVLVPQADGCSELHAMMASLLPDEWLRNRSIPRPVASFELWPFCPEWKGLDRTAIAKQVEEAFQHFIWKRVARTRDGLQVLHPESSVHAVFADPKHWMHALYRVALRRAEAQCSDLEPVNLGARFRDGLMMSGDTTFWGKTINLGDGKFLVENERGETSHITVPDVTVGPMALCGEHPKTREPLVYPGVSRYPTPAPTMLWDPYDQDSRDDVIQEVVNSDTLGKSIQVLLSESEPGDYKKGPWSDLRADALRRIRHRSKKVKIEFRGLCNDSAVYQGRAHEGEQDLIEGKDIFRGAMALFDAKEQRALVLILEGTTNNEIAQQLGYADHSGAKRLRDRILKRLRSWLT